MITQAMTLDNDMTYVVATAKNLHHPMVDEVSLAIGNSAYANFPYTVEVAFFKNGEWVTSIIDQFAPYADHVAGDTRVYAYVPLTLISTFIDNYRAR
jgi:hypothetical protein